MSSGILQYKQSDYNENNLPQVQDHWFLLKFNEVKYTYFT